MELKIESNASDIAMRVGATAKQVEAAARKATRAATRVLYDEDRRQINEIYKKPEDRITRGPRKGKKKWKRTGMLRRGEAMQFPDPLTGILHNDTPYAGPRHDLDRIGKSGVDRRVHWRKKTWEIVSVTAVEAFDAKFKEEMKL